MTGRPAGPAGKVLVLGLGNVLMGDDAFGPYVAATLAARYDLPPEVELVDAGTPGHELSVYLDGRDALVAVDSVRATGSPGDLHSFRGDEIVALPPSIAASPHEPGLRDALLKLSFGGRAPRSVLLIGVIPARIDPGVGLSPPVLAAVPRAVSAVLEALDSLGVPARERSVPRPPVIWWESAR